MAVRRASHQLPGVDPRSPITLSIPQHNLITSFQSITSSFSPTTQSQFAPKPQAYSPYNNSPHPFSFKNPTPSSSPISTPQRLFSFYEAFPTTNPPRIQAFTQTQTFTQTQSQIQNQAQFSTPAPKHTEVEVPGAPERRSLKFLLQTGRVPTVLVPCPCGNGRRTTKHILKECTHAPNSAASRQPLLSSPSTPYTPTRTPGTATSVAFSQTPTPTGFQSRGTNTPTARSPRSAGSRSPAEARAVHAVRKWRMRTLLGKYKEAVRKQEYSYGRVEMGGVRVQKSPRPDVVEMGLVGGRRWGRS